MAQTPRMLCRIAPLLILFALQRSAAFAQADEDSLAGRASYHNFDADMHSNAAETYKSGGFRLLSLSASGNASDRRYSAIWVARSGPQWRLYDNLFPRNNELEGTVGTEIANGMTPTLISAAGSGNDVFCSVALEAANGRTNWWYYGLTTGPEAEQGSFAYRNADARKAGYIPSSVTIYGDPSDHRIAATWVSNWEATQWWTEVVPASAVERVVAVAAQGGSRPGLISVAPDGTTVIVFRGDHLPGETLQANLVGSVGYKAKFDELFAQGIKPVVIAAGGVGDTARYTTLFAQDDQPIQRQLQVTGDELPAAADVDALMNAIVVRHGVRAAVVSIAKDGIVRGTRAYTNAEPGYPTTQPSTRFRVASLSKIFAAAELTALVGAGRLNWDTRAFEAAGITSPALPSQQVDSRTATTTLQQIVLRETLLRRDLASDRELASNMQDHSLPLSRESILKYLYGLPLIPEDTKDKYSNSAFYLATSVIESATGLSFIDALNRDVLTPLGHHRCRGRPNCTRGTPYG